MTGARHSKKDMTLINESRQKLREIDSNLVNLGAAEEEPEEDMPEEQPEPSAQGDMQEDDEDETKAAKGLIPASPIYIKAGLTIKAAGEWALEVLGVPFGDETHKDSDRQFFSKRTQLDINPDAETPVYYYHGLTPDGQPQQTPEKIGVAKFSRTDAQGHWFRVQLDKASAYAKRVWEAAKDGLARASSGSVAHLVRTAKNGEILTWPFAELSVFDAQGDRQPANPDAMVYPIAKARFIQPEAAGDAAAVNQSQNNEVEMDEKQVQELIAAALKAEQDKREAEAAKKAEFEAAVKAEVDKELAKARRLPFRQDVTIAQHSDEWQYDNLDAADQAFLIGTLESARKSGRSQGPSVSAYKALARKLEEDKSRVGEVARQAMKRAAVKADEVDYSTLANYGDEWVGIAYSQAIWDAIRIGTFVANKLPSVEIPQGMESMYLPLEGTDPVWYKVAENTTYDSTMKTPVATVPSSRLGTGRVLMTLAKTGARVLWTGEMEERSLIPFVNQLRTQLSTSGAEALEYAIINGDTATSSNINDIGGTTYSGAATSLFLLFNGFRKSPLVTTTANSRSAAGSLAVEDYLETIKLMGTAGINAMDQSKVGFIVDPNTYWSTMALAEIKTRDTFANPTLENGRLTGLWGYEINASPQMHRDSATRKANSAGKVDQDTVGNNLYGAILAVRYDQWRLGYQRRMTMETTRFANSDTNEIVAMMSVGLIQRDTEASAITYYVGL